MKPQVTAAAFILLKAGSILVERRMSTDDVDPGRVCIPGGGILEYETPEMALEREIQEELGVTAKEHKYLGSLVYPHIECDFLIHYYLVTVWEGDVQPLEAEDVFWIDQEHVQGLDVWVDRLIVKAIAQHT